MSLLLDTNVVSELTKPMPEPRVLAWMAAQFQKGLFLSSVTQAELRFGVELLPASRRREALAQAVDKLLSDGFKGRILPFDSDSAAAFAVIAASRQRAGRPIDHPDAQIAAIARARGFAVATRNVRDFMGCDVAVINPWEAA